MNAISIERYNYRRKLIMLVKQHPILWNKTQENYNRNPPEKMLAWNIISEQLDVPVDKLRRTWENLRDQYRRDLKRFGSKSKWRFFSDMDFIRDMVACKEQECKETELTDSDSEVDVTGSRQVHNNITPMGTTVESPYTIQTITTSRNSSPQPASITTTCPTGILPFQTIILSKQWQSVAEDLPQSSSAPEKTSFYRTSTESPSISPCENIAKQEPDSDMESHGGVTVLKQPVNDNEHSKRSQEPCVSTSCHKRSRMSTEEISDAFLPTTSRSQIIKPDEDFNVKDDDYHFVMSLLPYLRQIPKSRKFHQRIGIMSLIVKDLDEIGKE